MKMCCASDWQSTVDKLIKKTNLALVIGTHSWREQFVEAVTVSAGELFMSESVEKFYVKTIIVRTVFCPHDFKRLRQAYTWF